MAQSQIDPGPEVIKLEFILKLKIKCNDGLLVDTCPEAAHYCALSLRMNSSFITSDLILLHVTTKSHITLYIHDLHFENHYK